MDRIPEPELMEGLEQAHAYAEADFGPPHDLFVTRFSERFGPVTGNVLDLGCGPADISIRFARANPRCTVQGVDGAAAMVALGREAVSRAGLEGRISLFQAYLPGAILPLNEYGAIISNSLLHHLDDPRVLWETIKTYSNEGTRVFVMDLMRPGDVEEARRLVREYAADEPEILQRDFYHSLLAAYRPEEVRQQLAAAALACLNLQVVSDRHFVVSGVMHQP